MVFNSRWVATVATLSADACQYVACNPERLSSEQVLDLVCWLPLHHLRRLAVCLFSFFCFPVAAPPPNSRFYAYHRSFSASSSFSSSSSSSEDYDSAGYDSHSD